MSFTSFNLHPDLLRGVDAIGFTLPTAIQKEAIPPAMAGRDVLAFAVTGSGKTAAYVNFDVPNLPEDYIHRVGRTARADATGTAYTFVSPDEESSLRTIERALRTRIERTPLRQCRPGPFRG